MEELSKRMDRVELASIFLSPTQFLHAGILLSKLSFRDVSYGPFSGFLSQWLSIFHVRTIYWPFRCRGWTGDHLLSECIRECRCAKYLWMSSLAILFLWLCKAVGPLHSIPGKFVLVLLREKINMSAGWPAEVRGPIVSLATHKSVTRIQS